MFGMSNSRVTFPELVGQSMVFQRMLELLAKVAASDSAVLIAGEAGTGKEAVARVIHRLSKRRSNSFLRINCAAEDRSLEIALFGRERGGLEDVPTLIIGGIESADQGTLFLNEIGNVPLHLQPKLLRVLQEQEFERVGSTQVIRSDVRLIAATRQNLGNRVAAGHFRGELFYRLNACRVHIPPLRERREDIPLLVRHFVQKFARRMNKRIDTISDQVMDALTQRDWPGNVRQLENLIQHSVGSTEGPSLQVSFPEI